MAEGKNRIVVYRDWINTFDSLSDEEAGRLIKHFFRYINDMNPESPDRLTSLLFEPIKQTLKRDLKAYEAICLKNRDNINKRWYTEDTTVYHRIRSDTKHTDSDIDSDKDKDKDKEDTIPPVFNFKKSLVALGIEENIVSAWLAVRQKKKATNSEIAFNAIRKQIELSGAPANECIKKAVEKSWSGFEAEWYKNTKTPALIVPEFQSGSKR